MFLELEQEASTHRAGQDCLWGQLGSPFQQAPGVAGVPVGGGFGVSSCQHREGLGPGDSTWAPPVDSC